MIPSLKQEASSHGDKLKILPISRLQNLKNEIELFQKTESLNNFQNWIVDQKYQFKAPDSDFTPTTVLVVAIPHPPYAGVEFVHQGKTFDFVSLVKSDFDATEKYLRDFLTPRGYHIRPAPNLPLKRLAARSGLAVYGRNNICYVEGLGSFFSLAAYFSDLPCDEDDWTEMSQAGCCVHCTICFENCPTGAIRKERFLIDNEKCLSYFNEAPGEFPEWIPPSAHHSLYDCLKCQINCPMNKNLAHQGIQTIHFSADETECLLSGSPFEAFSPALKQKSSLLGLDDWPDAISRNLKVLLKLSPNDYFLRDYPSRSNLPGRVIDWAQEARSFDTVAKLYDMARPSYPAELIEFILSTTGIAEGGSILEIGSGTGIATALFAQRGYPVLCIEPGRNLLAVARRKLRRFSSVKFTKTMFEDWEEQENAFDLVISAQAFHWISKETGYAKAARALRSNGHIALFWNMYPNPQGQIFEDLNRVYETYASELISPNQVPFEDLVQQREKELAGCGYFDHLETKRFPWSCRYTPPQYLNLLNSYSDHLRLSEENRSRLFAEIAKVIYRHGGYIDKSYVAVAYVAQKAA